MRSLMILVVMAASPVWAESATCTIEIEDNDDLYSVYKLEYKFIFESGGPAQRRHFAIPGHDYTCTLAFFDLSSGTMISCEYTVDLGETFFQSDRSVVSETNIKNNLSFRHNGAQIYLTTECH